MKLKARDIIAGWPRGRSTTVSYSNDKWKYVYEYNWWSLDVITKKMIAQLVLDNDYHQKQQEMVNRYFIRYRTTPQSHLELIALFTEVWDNLGVQHITWNDADEGR